MFKREQQLCFLIELMQKVVHLRLYNNVQNAYEMRKSMSSTILVRGENVKTKQDISLERFAFDKNLLFLNLAFS